MHKKAAVIFLVLFFVMPLGAFTNTSAEAAVLYDPLTGKFLYDKNPNQSMGIASTTKIMTAIIAIENYDVYETVKIQPEWTGAEGSSIYLTAGEEISILDILYGLMLESGNDAAVALSYIYSGEPEDFINLMNEKAVELGLQNTHFMNPSGLSDDMHYSSAADMAYLTAYCLENETFAKIVSTKSYKTGTRYFENHNRLLSTLPGCNGVKTGYTIATGRCLVSSVTRNGRTLICVTLRDRDDWLDHTNLHNAAFSGEMTEYSLPAGHIGSVDVVSQPEGTSALYINEDFDTGLFSGDTTDMQILGPRFCYSSIAGEVYGQCRVYLNDLLVFETPVYFADTVISQEEPGFFQKILALFTKPRN